ncbi:hypothetical protein KTT_41180 [Tengunoibacter tsumagoiensis]|uniref:Uncharacterized protein n=2 Tax=Tengunoibacter tsumagoiensis TaxID=2014871 RepID=A0A402A5B5_9CHLR|nr:hypothetical protein KTT_40640 [Tengunoibacter tsumagoiensis]GCE14259.1 hypothetical protein KTT_41180 [Tengunoibacter tsumagoiensis]
MANIIDNIRSCIVRIVAPGDTLRFSGLVRVRELPRDCDLTDFMEWWPRLAANERDRYTVYEHKNVLTSAGRAQLLTYIGSSTATTLGFAQFFAVGTFPINAVSPGDTSVQTEIFRAVPGSQTITGTQIDISTYFGPSQANGTYTNAGLYGINATSTIGSGTLMTHTLYAYTKPNGTPITNDYLISLQ